MRLNLSIGRLLTLSAPLLSVVALYFSFSWFGIFRIVPDWVRLLLLGLFGLGVLASLWPLLRFRSPGRAEIDARLEAENRIANQAIATQDDKIEADDAFARALWEEHRRRMASKIGALETGIPRSSLPQRDPWGMRVALALLLFVAFGYSYSGNAGRPSDAFLSHSSEQLPDVRIDAWITPPPYVNQAPVFLTGIERPQGEPSTPSRAARSPSASAVEVPTHRCCGGMVRTHRRPSNRQMRIRQPQPAPRQVHRPGHSSRERTAN
jgi:uncharacterized protein (TIGR02302 family)